MPKLTSEQYAEIGGAFCPVCEANDIEGGSIEIDSGGAFQNCYCLNCGATWIDEYKLTGYSTLTDEDGETI